MLKLEQTRYALETGRVNRELVHIYRHRLVLIHHGQVHRNNRRLELHAHFLRQLQAVRLYVGMALLDGSNLLPG